MCPVPDAGGKPCGFGGFLTMNSGFSGKCSRSQLPQTGALSYWSSVSAPQKLHFITREAYHSQWPRDTVGSPTLQLLSAPLSFLQTKR